VRGRRSGGGWSWSCRHAARGQGKARGTVGRAGRRSEGTDTDRFVTAGKNLVPTLDSLATFPGGDCAETWPAQRGSEAHEGGHTGDLKRGGKWHCSGHAEEQRGMERGDENEEEELASLGSGAGDKDGIFDARGGGRGPAAAVAGDRRGEAVTGPRQHGRACAHSDRGTWLSGWCN
jgi:hypothetical protein